MLIIILRVENCSVNKYPTKLILSCEITSTQKLYSYGSHYIYSNVFLERR
jgi:hypothetical protein